jgi:hypothetical protein
MNDLFEQFEAARKAYPGVKRGAITEYENLTKKHRDYKEVIPLFMAAIKKQAAWRSRLRSANKFAPEWPHFQTWINQRRWEEENGEPSAQQKDTMAEHRKAIEFEKLKASYAPWCKEQTPDVLYQTAKRMPHLQSVFAALRPDVKFDGNGTGVVTETPF